MTTKQPEIGRFLAATLLAFVACKPSVGSRILEAPSGGSSPGWRLKSTLSNNGSLRLEKTGENADLSAYTIQKVELQVADSVAEGRVNDLQAGRYMPLGTGEAEVKFNVLLTTTEGQLCYVNETKLNGAAEPVKCTTVPENVNDLTAEARTALKGVCRSLANIAIPASESGTATGNYARYDQNNDQSCTCRNGEERQLKYSDFAGMAIADARLDFEYECRRRANITAENKNYDACEWLELCYESVGDAKKPQAKYYYCQCGSTQMSYDDSTYQNKPVEFAAACETASGVTKNATCAYSTSTRAATGTGTGTGGGTNTRTNTNTNTGTDAGLLRDLRAKCSALGYQDLENACSCDVMAGLDVLYSGLSSVEALEPAMRGKCP